MAWPASLHLTFSGDLTWLEPEKSDRGCKIPQRGYWKFCGSIYAKPFFFLYFVAIGYMRKKTSGGCWFQHPVPRRRLRHRRSQGWVALVKLSERKIRVYEVHHFLWRHKRWVITGCCLSISHVSASFCRCMLLVENRCWALTVFSTYIARFYSKCNQWAGFRKGSLVLSVSDNFGRTLGADCLLNKIGRH